MTPQEKLIEACKTYLHDLKTPGSPLTKIGRADRIAMVEEALQSAAAPAGWDYVETFTDGFTAYELTNPKDPAGPQTYIDSSGDLDELIGVVRDYFDPDEAKSLPIIIRNAAGITVAKITDKNTVIRY